MKTVFRLPMNDPYAYIEMEGDEETFEAALEKYKHMMTLVKGGEGLPEKDMNVFVDNMLLGSTENHIETYNAMTDDQRRTVQIIKRAIKRLEARQART